MVALNTIRIGRAGRAVIADERVVWADAAGIQAGSGERAISPREFAQLLDLGDLMGVQFFFRPPLRLLKLKQHRQQ